MTILERKRLYKDFEESVKHSWEYHVEKSIFNKALSKKGSFYNYATKGAKDNGKFSEEIMANHEELFKYYIAFLLNDNKEPKLKWWIVKGELVLNVFLNEKKKELIIMMNKFEGTSAHQGLAKKRLMIFTKPLLILIELHWQNMVFQNL